MDIIDCKLWQWLQRGFGLFCGKICHSDNIYFSFWKDRRTNVAARWPKFSLEPSPQFAINKLHYLWIDLWRDKQWSIGQVKNCETYVWLLATPRFLVFRCVFHWRGGVIVTEACLFCHGLQIFIGFFTHLALYIYILTLWLVFLNSVVFSIFFSWLFNFWTLLYDRLK